MILQYTQGMYYERSIRSEAHHLVNLNAFSCQKISNEIYSEKRWTGLQDQIYQNQMQIWNT